MISKKSLSLLIASALSIGFVGCGGGGSSAPAGSSLAFPSNAVSATPTLDNGKKVKDAVSTNNTTGNPFLNGIAQTSSVNIGLLNSEISQRILEKTKDLNLQTYALNEVVDETNNCSGGGTIHYNGNGNDTNGGTITYTFDSCVESNVKLNGSIYASMSNNDGNGNFKDLSIKYTTDFTVVSGNFSSTIAKDSYENINVTQYSSYGSLEKFKASISLIATTGTQKYGVKDAVYYYLTNDGQMSMYQTQGKVYIDNLASFVNYDTSYDMSQTPFVFNGSGLASGEAHYNMANSGKVKIVAQSGVVKTYVDANNDGTYELHE